MAEALDGAISFLDAKINGRAVILPCKVGDTVYAVTRCEDVEMRHDDDYFTGTGAVECPFEKSCDSEDCNGENIRIFETTCKGFWFEEDWCGVFLDNLKMECYMSDFGKALFLAPEKAKAKLKEDAQ
jgi:hypothetical protein